MTGLLAADAAKAFQPQRPGDGRLELASGAAVRKARMTSSVVAPQAAAAALRRLGATMGRLEVVWDRDTGVPLRLWGAGLAAPGAVDRSARAQKVAQELLARHLDLLAPGSDAADFVLVGDDLSSGIRSLGYAQHYRGRPVLGGQISFRFKHDRLAMIGSEALPKVQAVLTDSPVADDVARGRARAWIAGEAAVTRADAVAGPFILPIVEAGRPIVYREVLAVTVHAERPIGRWTVYVDAATGEPVARRQELMFATGVLLYDAPLRGPAGARANFAGSDVSLLINGAAGSSDAQGVVTIPDGGASTLTVDADGPLIAVDNESGGNAQQALLLAPAGAALWSAPADEQIDAQISGFVHASRVKQFVRAIAPDFAYLDQQLQVNVNIQDICNAFSDGDTINFFVSGSGCENTALISDVVYHEFGHSVHVQGIIPGVGAFEGALSEGISDYLSATIVDDASVAPGFFIGDEGPLRELDPVDSEWRWPDDIGEVHDQGRIIGGALWDLRKALRNKLGAQQGSQRTDLIWFESIRRATDIPTMYPEALLIDDNDGDLLNGTPNECEINVAFDRHGLVSGNSVAASVVQGPPTPAGAAVTLLISGSPKACLSLEPKGAELQWRVRGEQTQGSVTLSPAPGGFVGAVPSPGDGKVVEYQVILDMGGGASVRFPQNPADPRYQVYFGPVQPIFCSGFEPNEPPGLFNVVSGPWQGGAPQGVGGDPPAPFTGVSVVGTQLDAPGTYLPFSEMSLRSAVIPVQGFPTVRLQYRRWLEVEDGTFDHARILVNGVEVWNNAASPEGNVHHLDGEWRFHDIDITPAVQNGQVELEFVLTSDEAAEFGGWTMDELCVVGTDVPTQACGDGVVGPGEACDNGGNNSDTLPDACRTDCQAAACGDGVVDSIEGCDDGNLVDGDGCTALCEFEAIDPPTTGFDPLPPTSDGSSSGDTDSGTPEDGDLNGRGCACSTGGAGGGAPGLALLGLLALRRRRRI